MLSTHLNVNIQPNITFVFNDLLWTEYSGIFHNKNHMVCIKVRAEHACLGPFHALMQRHTLKACINIHLYSKETSLAFILHNYNKTLMTMLPLDISSERER